MGAKMNAMRFALPAAAYASCVPMLIAVAVTIASVVQINLPGWKFRRST